MKKIEELDKEYECEDCTEINYCYVHLIMLNKLTPEEAQTAIKRRNKGI